MLRDRMLGGVGVRATYLDACRAGLDHGQIGVAQVRTPWARHVAYDRQRSAAAPRDIPAVACPIAPSPAWRWVGIVGGIYGIGGGSILGPSLVGRGLPVAKVAPAALTSTFLTSVVGAITYAILGLATAGNIDPDWTLGLLCGLGGLVGGYLGARLQPHVPETGLRWLLGSLAAAIAVLYLVQAS